MRWLKQLLGLEDQSTTAQQDVFSTIETQERDSYYISPIEVKEKLDQGESIVLLDIREDQEVEITSLNGALHIPMEDISIRYKEISDDPNAEIVVFCHHGIRSEMVMHQLWGLGYQNAKNMLGGIDAWSVEIDPKVPRY